MKSSARLETARVTTHRAYTAIREACMLSRRPHRDPAAKSLQAAILVHCEEAATLLDQARELLAEECVERRQLALL